MTTPPKARRYHATVTETVAPARPQAAADQPGAPARVEVTRKPQDPTSSAEAAKASDQARLERLMATEPQDDGFGD
ncbi:MAG: hypothetical protein FJX25_13635, partial [Alphaproteobacteria bacterium]|nr:hypothetical protein [Alphaproteobacteria bacterium]